MERKKNVVILIFIFWGLIALGLLSYESNSELKNSAISSSPSVLSPTVPTLSTDKKSILEDTNVLLTVGDEKIFNWFTEESGLCTLDNIGNTPSRKKYCSNKTSFVAQTKFSSIAFSGDKSKIAFTIETDELTPDTVIGVFIRPEKKIHILTNFYLGNTFIGFSPNGGRIAYYGNCFEGKCGLFIMNTASLTEHIAINNPQYADHRTEKVTFIKWISENEIEYEIKNETKRLILQ